MDRHHFGWQSQGPNIPFSTEAHETQQRNAVLRSGQSSAGSGMGYQSPQSQNSMTAGSRYVDNGQDARRSSGFTEENSHDYTPSAYMPGITYHPSSSSFPMNPNNHIQGGNWHRQYSNDHLDQEQNYLSQLARPSMSSRLELGQAQPYRVHYGIQPAGRSRTAWTDSPLLQHEVHGYNSSNTISHNNQSRTNPFLHPEIRSSNYNGYSDTGFPGAMPTGSHPYNHTQTTQGVGVDLASFEYSGNERNGFGMSVTALMSRGGPNNGNHHGCFGRSGPSIRSAPLETGGNLTQLSSAHGHGLSSYKLADMVSNDHTLHLSPNTANPTLAIQTQLMPVKTRLKNSKENAPHQESWHVDGKPYRGTAPWQELRNLAQDNPEKFIEDHPDDLHEDFLWIICSKKEYSPKQRLLNRIRHYHNRGVTAKPVDPKKDHFGNTLGKAIKRASEKFGLLDGYKCQVYEPKGGWLDVWTWREQKCPKVIEYTQAEKAALKKAQENAPQATKSRERPTKRQRTQSGTYSNSAASTSEGRVVDYSPTFPGRHPQPLPTLTDYRSHQGPLETVPPPCSSFSRALPPYIPYQGLLESIPGTPSNSPPNVPAQPDQKWALGGSHGAPSHSPRGLAQRLSQKGFLDPMPPSFSHPQQTARPPLLPQATSVAHLRGLPNSPQPWTPQMVQQAPSESRRQALSNSSQTLMPYLPQQAPPEPPLRALSDPSGSSELELDVAQDGADVGRFLSENNFMLVSSLEPQEVSYDRDTSYSHVNSTQISDQSQKRKRDEEDLNGESNGEDEEGFDCKSTPGDEEGFDYESTPEDDSGDHPHLHWGAKCIINDEVRFVPDPTETSHARATNITLTQALTAPVPERRAPRTPSPTHLRDSNTGCGDYDVVDQELIEKSEQELLEVFFGPP